MWQIGEYMPLLFAMGVLGAISLVTFILYALDKIKAKLKTRRIPEKTLLLFSIFGGGAGGALAMLLCRHKTRHWYFVAVNAVGLALQAAVLVLTAIYM